MNNFFFLSQNEFGIFVLSSMLENSSHNVKIQMLTLIRGNAASMSLQRDGSKLIENAIKILDNPIKNTHLIEAATHLLQEIVSLPVRKNEGGIMFQQLLTNQFSNYVVQRCF